MYVYTYVIIYIYIYTCCVCGCTYTYVLARKASSSCSPSRKAGRTLLIETHTSTLAKCTQPLGAAQASDRPSQGGEPNRPCPD